MQPAPPPDRPRPSPRAVRKPGDVAPELPAEPAPARRPLPRVDLLAASEQASSIEQTERRGHRERRRYPEPTGGLIQIGDETIRVPGLLAALRRNPHNVQHASIGVIAAGVALFVIASITTPLAGAQVAGHPAPAPPTTTAPAVVPSVNLSIGPPAPAVRKTLKRQPTHVKVQAPVNHGVISGLAANGIPKVALNAYRVAAARMGNVQPSCGIDWALLAGIGREESDHGRFGGAQLHADGTSTPRIIGPALDGVHWDFIPAPGNGAQLAGDTKFAHALGPMQFIPSTWGSYGADANGDGNADIFNINDAALGSARYLCAAGGNLRTHAGQVAGVLTYNHSDQYLAQVLALADAYRRGVPITGIPLGITTGALPKVADTGYIPPANPGAPTAVDTAKQTAKAKARAKAKATKTTAASSASKTAKPTPARTTTKPASTPTGKSSTPTPKPTPTKTTASPSPSPTKCTLLGLPVPCKTK
ncbi:MAG: hypothetical protein QOF92_4879 [Pseudonocardiales bacterium]|nr:hypothetical protein [Pseudonocardiales bacterium]